MPALLVATWFCVRCMPAGLWHPDCKGLASQAGLGCMAGHASSSWPIINLQEIIACYELRPKITELHTMADKPGPLPSQRRLDIPRRSSSSKVG